MPVLRGAVTFSRFRVEPAKEAPSDIKRWLTRGLKSHAFEPIDRRSEEERAVGFVELENADSSEFPTSRLFYGEYALFAFRIDTIKVPAAAMKAEMTKWASAFEKENDRPPSRAEKNTFKAEVRQMLRNRATPRTALLDVSWNLKSNEMQIWATSRKVVDEICIALENALSLKFTGLTPSDVARTTGIDEKSLGPTAELIGMDLPASAVEEVSRVEA
ncbi:recombination-associated protein RdgC [Pyxidicoccus fallax]|uniref:Recombination-associated protein RdgC n=1 Tax=Pyxidicoccus fallax TaxID=394095 RepID=A0A848L933_9BACT|nr:recombination-associated protein RdgC [Pyxidicoccus fallax]NMO15067.1 recombination-associated protein RdgC [Pyxidicoccus fallax]NPC78245.1 recombination-associated protein RdgC [Pyxidicoccus fallax]